MGGLLKVGFSLAVIQLQLSDITQTVSVLRRLGLRFIQVLKVTCQ